MAEVLKNSLPVRMGNCVEVYNMEKMNYPRLLKDDPDTFVCIQVEKESGNEEDEFAILLTKEEYNALKKTVVPKESPFAKNKPGRLYCKYDYSTCANVFVVRLKGLNKRYFLTTLTMDQMKNFYETALTYEQSITKKGAITNFFD